MLFSFPSAVNSLICDQGNYLSLFERGFSGDLSVFILTPVF